MIKNTDMFVMIKDIFLQIALIKIMKNLKNKKPHAMTLNFTLSI